MDNKKKKFIMIFVCVLCALLAGFVGILNSKSKDKLGSLKGETTWLKCINQDCLNEFEVDKVAYYQYIEDHKKPENPFYTPPYPCPKCSKDSCYKAFKCEKCEKVSLENSVPNSYKDKCPHCGYSKTEAEIKSK